MARHLGTSLLQSRPWRRSARGRTRTLVERSSAPNPKYAAMPRDRAWRVRRQPHCATPKASRQRPSRQGTSSNRPHVRVKPGARRGGWPRALTRPRWPVNAKASNKYRCRYLSQWPSKPPAKGGGRLFLPRLRKELARRAKGGHEAGRVAHRPLLRSSRHAMADWLSLLNEVRIRRHPNRGHDGSGSCDFAQDDSASPRVRPPPQLAALHRIGQKRGWPDERMD